MNAVPEWVPTVIMVCATLAILGFGFLMFNTMTDGKGEPMLVYEDQDSECVKDTGPNYIGTVACTRPDGTQYCAYRWESSKTQYHDCDGSTEVHA